LIVAGIDVGNHTTEIVLARVHDGEVHVFRTPADPAAVFQPTAAAAARRQSSVNSASHRLGVKVGRLGYPDEVLRIDVALKSIGWAAAPLPALWFVVTLLRARQASRAGMCRHCGYDVRATPDRCPECGMPVARPGVPMTPQAPALV